MKKAKSRIIVCLLAFTMLVSVMAVSAFAGNADVSPLTEAEKRLNSFLESYGTASSNLGKGGLADKIEEGVFDLTPKGDPIRDKSLIVAF